MSASIIIDRTINAPIAKAWSALTDVNELRHWYFDLTEFKAEVGFKFQFLAGASPAEEWLHLCEVVEVVPGKKIAYTWRYDGEPGNSVVSFELFEQADATRFRLTHTGMESFASAGSNFSRESFTGGWTHFSRSFKAYLDPSVKQDYKKSVKINAPAQQMFETLTAQISNWWTDNFEGSGNALNDTFTVHFGQTYKTMLVEELVPNEKVVWFCKDAFMDIASFSNKKEWVGTKLIWEIENTGGEASLTFTHMGLNIDLDCYDVCVSGWEKYLHSLASFVEKHEGAPLKMPNRQGF